MAYADPELFQDRRDDITMRKNCKTRLDHGTGPRL